MFNYRKNLSDGVHKSSKKKSLIFFCLALFLLINPICLSAQDGKVSISVNNVTLKQFFDTIEKQSKYKFSYRDSALQGKENVSINAENKSLEEILNEILQTRGLQYTTNGTNIVITPSGIKETTPKTINGIVTDTKGEPIIGANIVVKGSTIGNITDINGKFTIEASAKATLQISYIGYQSEEVAVNSKNNLTITLKEDTELLDEIVVVGYGVQKKSDLTGSVSSLKAEAIENQPVTRIDQALQGRIPGMQITTLNGAPGAATTVRIRGGNSINGGNEPLYVIDGIIGGGDLSMINPADIQSIEILKDASSTAIYGSRGANGVVLVTTKMGKGTEGVRLNYHGYFGLQSAVKFLDVLDGPEYAQWRNEYEKYFNRNELFDVNNVADIDWQKEMYKIAPLTEHNVSLSKSNNTGNYFLSLNYLNQGGILENTNFKRYQMRFNLEQDISNSVKIGINSSMIFTDRDNPSINTSGLGTLPVIPIYDEDGKFASLSPIAGNHIDTPSAQKAYKTSNTTNFRGFGNLFVQYTPIKNLVLKSSFGFDLNRSKQNEYTSVNMPSRVYAKSGGYAYVGTSFPISFQNENTVNYGIDMGKHHFDVLGGWTIQQYSQEFQNTSASGFTNDVSKYHAMETADPTTKDIQTGESEWSMASALFRVNYGFDNRYLLTISGRADASSRLSPDNRWAFFPSAALAWRVSEEQFIKDIDVISDLKFRASYGRSGSQSINPYSTLDKLSSGETVMGNVQAIYFQKNNVSNKNLTWEKTDQVDIGLNFGLFRNRLTFELDWYKKKTTDLLLNRELAWQTGFQSMLENVGSVSNQGFEFAVSSVNFDTKDFTWNTSLTISANKSKVLDLAGKEFLENGLGSRLIVGEPIGTFFGAKYLGTWKEGEIPEGSKFKPGDPKFVDKDNNGVCTVADGEIIGNAEPAFYGGINNTFTYKNVSVNLFFDFSVGNDIYDLYGSNGYGGYNTNVYGSARDRWSPENPTSDIPTAGSGFKYIYDTYAGKSGCSLFVQDGSFLRLKNLNVEYKIPQFTKVIKGFSVYGSVSNLFTLTKYDGYSPDVNSEGTHSTRRGFDNNVYPQSRTYLVGLKMTF